MEVIVMQEDKNAIFQMRFPQKLWYLLDLRTEAILWGGTGRTILLNYRILHNYLQCNNSIFKTTNISSFVRQLNLYGFKKVTSHLQDPICNSSNPYMHEYVHDYFQFGRPELLNKITRKALAMKKNFKPKVLCDNVEQLLYLTPLQKARRALKIALKKAAQDMVIQHSSKPFRFDWEEDYDDDENIEFDWLTLNNDSAECILPITVNNQENNKPVKNDNLDEKSPNDIIYFNDDSCQHSTGNFSGQFLSMPDLDPVPSESSPGVELLAEFNIENDAEQHIVKKITDKGKDSSLNCVLPSISNDQIDDISIAENNEHSAHYHREWDQMFSDIMANKGPNQECGSDLKELYSQISKTIDLLNS